MTEEQLKALTEKYQARLADTVVAIEKITTVFTDGTHPFTVGPKHVEFASDNYGGRLGDAARDDPAFPGCAARGCGHAWKNPVHNSEVACYVRMRRATTQKEACDAINTVKAEMEADGISMFGFVNHTLITDWGEKKPA